MINHLSKQNHHSSRVILFFLLFLFEAFHQQTLVNQNKKNKKRVTRSIFIGRTKIGQKENRHLSFSTNDYINRFFFSFPFRTCSLLHFSSLFRFSSLSLSLSLIYRIDRNSDLWSIERTHACVLILLHLQSLIIYIYYSTTYLHILDSMTTSTKKQQQFYGDYINPTVNLVYDFRQWISILEIHHVLRLINIHREKKIH